MSAKRKDEDIQAVIGRILENVKENEESHAEPEPLRFVSREDLKKSRRVPEEHIRSVYDKTPIDCDALARVKEWLASDSRILVLSGGLGTLKSGSACWVLTQKAGKFVMAEQLADLSMTQEPDTREVYQSLRACMILVIDELGTEFNDGKGYFVNIFNGLVVHRMQEMLRTIITCNLTPARFEQAYGSRLLDRMRSAGTFVQIGGESVRRKP